MEDRDPNATITANNLIRMFGSRFHDMQFTVHPANIPDEAPGKSSNIKWAAQEVERKYYQHSRWRDVLVTVMDSKYLSL